MIVALGALAIGLLGGTKRKSVPAQKSAPAAAKAQAVESGASASDPHGWQSPTTPPTPASKSAKSGRAVTSKDWPTITDDESVDSDNDSGDDEECTRTRPARAASVSDDEEDASSGREVLSALRDAEADRAASMQDRGLVGRSVAVKRSLGYGDDETWELSVQGVKDRAARAGQSLDEYAQGMGVSDDMADLWKDHTDVSAPTRRSMALSEMSEVSTTKKTYRGPSRAAGVWAATVTSPADAPGADVGEIGEAFDDANEDEIRLPALDSRGRSILKVLESLGATDAAASARANLAL